jgi:hypothetical protein
MLDEPRQDPDCTECGAGPKGRLGGRSEHAAPYSLTPASSTLGPSGDTKIEIVLNWPGHGDHTEPGNAPFAVRRTPNPGGTGR